MVEFVKGRESMHIPLFIEVLQSQANSSAQICRKVMAHLYRRNISPLPFASSIYEIADVMHALREKNLAPAIFVVNTYWAEEILRDLDAMVGDTPILLLERRLTAARILNGNADSPLQDFSSRQIATCRYGATTSDETAETVANALVQFAGDSAFWRIEALGGMSSPRLRPIPGN